jgi:hypothetical protein
MLPRTRPLYSGAIQDVDGRMTAHWHPANEDMFGDRLPCEWCEQGVPWHASMAPDDHGVWHPAHAHPDSGACAACEGSKD